MWKLDENGHLERPVTYQDLQESTLMPYSQKQRKAACARAHGSGRVMKSMPKEQAAEMCKAPLKKPAKKK